MSDSGNTVGAGSVTSVITRRVRRRTRDAYETQLRDLLDGSYTMVVRFASLGDLDRYQRSHRHRQFLDGIAPLVEASR